MPGVLGEIQNERLYIKQITSMILVRFEREFCVRNVMFEESGTTDPKELSLRLVVNYYKSRCCVTFRR